VPHYIEYRVYYEDTDAGGIVYYANYLKFAERARTEMLRAAGINQSALRNDQNLGFVVRRASIELFKPARLDDMLRIESSVEEMSGTSITMVQHIFCGECKLSSIAVLIVLVDCNLLKPKRISEEIRNKFTQYALLE